MIKVKKYFFIILLFFLSCGKNELDKPNILFIMSDDHTSQAWGIYGGILADYVKNDGIKRLEKSGIVLENMFCTNSICVPSRASILTGKYSHINGVYNLPDALDPDSLTVSKILQNNGYQTSLIGKWHLKKEPSGFDFYKVLPGQGLYNNPYFKTKENWEDGYKGGVQENGFSADIIGDSSIEWLSKINRDKPFFMMTHFKATHEPFDYPERHNLLNENIELPEPESLYDFEHKNSGRLHIGQLVENLTERWENDKKNNVRRYPGNPVKTKNLSKKEIRSKTYQKFVKDFLRSGAAIDDNIVKILDYLEKENLIENTVIIYTSDQGYFLGEHGYMDKRWFYEESSKMPFVVSYPKLFEQNKRISDLFLNIDIPSFFLDLAEIKKPKSFQGLSFKNRLTGKHYDSRDFIYYRYWQHEVKRPAHLGIRSKNHKLIYVYGDGLNKSGVQNEKTIPTWEYYDLKIDPKENRNRINDSNYIEVIKKLQKQLIIEKALVKDFELEIPEI
tara:strand:+ start:973 stop:2481 length:1509 start_codon:yes stop_codon:yes gene_type:complete